MCILMLLSKKEMYGYEISKTLRHFGSSLHIEEGTLYPLLRRLEQRGYIIGEWKITCGRARKYYRISQKGRIILNEMLKFWNDLVKTVNMLMRGEKNE